MKSERRATKSNAKRRMQRRRQNAKRFMNGVIGVVLVLVICLGFGNHFSGVEKVEAAVESSSYECSENASSAVLYKAIEIQRGETLWTIAESNMDGRYDTVAAYVDELQLINNLSDHDADMLQAGDYLTISYLADQV